MHTVYIIKLEDNTIFWEREIEHKINYLYWSNDNDFTLLTYSNNYCGVLTSYKNFIIREKVSEQICLVHDIKGNLVAIDRHVMFSGSRKKKGLWKYNSYIHGNFVPPTKNSFFATKCLGLFKTKNDTRYMITYEWVKPKELRIYLCDLHKGHQNRMFVLRQFSNEFIEEDFEGFMKTGKIEPKIKIQKVSFKTFLYFTVQTSHRPHLKICCLNYMVKNRRAKITRYRYDEFIEEKLYGVGFSLNNNNNVMIKEEEESKNPKGNNLFKNKNLLDVKIVVKKY